ncbi:Aromatase [Frankliniella fusca]|uniref:Aromatase n=1 Tax=Frankliniella fusca TaxID=407009 RepID=A0AAE1GXT9_9NEOP|nr:Aromatase [Frankliniella fusca]
MAVVRYDMEIKLFSVYLFIVAGRFIYEWLYENLKPALPSLSEVERTLANSSEPVKEGKFRFSELSEFLNVNNLIRKVFIAEDGTRIVQKFVYDLTSDQIIGCVPPFADNGVPIMNSFPASAAALIATHFEKGIPSSTAYAIMVQPAQYGAPSFCLSMFGSNNRFTTEHVFKGWHYIYDELSKLGIECLGFAADGDPKVLNAMHTVMFSPGAPCPKEFKDFYFAPGELKFSVMQDYIHTVNKFRNRLSPSHYLPLGKYSASQSHLIILMDTMSKEQHGLTPAVMAKDKMNFNASMKICSERVTSLMEEHVPGSEGTVEYLNVMRCVMEAGLNKSLSPLEVIFKIWYATFFFRYWKNWLISNPKFTLDNFVSRNLYMCVEIIAHSIICLILKSRTQNSKECLLIHLFSSQICESIFRLLRSMTSTESTVINFSMEHASEI